MGSGSHRDENMRGQRCIVSALVKKPRIEISLQGEQVDELIKSKK
jgi:nitrogen regulatory protein PII